MLKGCHCQSNQHVLLMCNLVMLFFNQRFIVSDITSPLLAFGAVLQSGWNLFHEECLPEGWQACRNHLQEQFPLCQRAHFSGEPSWAQYVVSTCHTCSTAGHGFAVLCRRLEQDSSTFFWNQITVQWKVFTSSTTTHTPYSVQGSLQLKRAHQGGSSS